MPIARIVTAYTQEVAKLAGQLRARGYTVETVVPGEVRAGTPDLEITVDRCALEDGLVRAAEAAFAADADIVVAPGMYAPAPQSAPEYPAVEGELVPAGGGHAGADRQPEASMAAAPVEICETAPDTSLQPEVTQSQPAESNPAPGLAPVTEAQTDFTPVTEARPEIAPLPDLPPAGDAQPKWPFSPVVAESGLEPDPAAPERTRPKFRPGTYLYGFLVWAGRKLEAVGAALVISFAALLLQLRLAARKSAERKTARPTRAKAQPQSLPVPPRPRVAESPQPAPGLRAAAAVAAVAAPIRRARSLSVRQREWITAGVFSVALAGAILFGWAAANRRPASPLPARVLMRSVSTEQKVPFGPVKLLPPGTPATSSGAVVAPRPAQPPKPARTARHAARHRNSDPDDEVIVRHFAPSQPAHAAEQSRNGVKHFSDME